jgi:drug/metabolite transporter (DMT)-like permease
MIIAGVLDALAFIASTIAIKRSSISLLAPISSFNPVFTTLFAIVGLGEIPTFTRLLGIIIVVIGAYLLNIQDLKEGILMPFKKLFADKSVQLFLFANVIWGLTPIFQKQALLSTMPHAPLFVSLIGFFVMTISILPFVYNQLPKISGFIVQNYNVMWFVLIALGGVTSTAAAFTVFSLTNVGYATAVFKLSVLFTVLGGAFFFKEKNIKQRLFASVVMLLGTMLLLL